MNQDVNSLSSQSNSYKSDWLIAGGLFLSAFLLRAIGLFRLDVWFDEIAILLQTNLPISQLWKFNQSENFPPLFPWIVKLWSYFVTSDWCYRLLAALIGSAVPPAAYFLAKEIKSRRFAVLLGVACVICLPLIYYSQVVRMYGLFTVFSVISYIFFLRAIKDNRFSYWIIVAIANLLAFYTFLFGVLMIAAEFTVLFWRSRKSLKKLAKPLLTHLPAFLLMSFWIVVLMNRSSVVQSYAKTLDPFGDFLRIWAFFGSGAIFNDKLIPGLVVNIPLFIGFFLGLFYRKKDENLKISVQLMIIVILLVVIISVVEFPVLDSRYLLFLIPLYLIIVFSGWMHLSKLWQLAGIIAVFLTLSLSTVYYYLNFLPVNDAFRYHGVFVHSESNDGNCYSRMADTLQKRLKPGEVILHFGAPYLRSFTFFASIYFHHRSLPEYLFTKEDLTEAVGRQYLLPGEQIDDISDLKPIPKGIWIVTLSDPEILITAGEKRDSTSTRIPAWLETESLPEQLVKYNFQFQEIIRDGSLSALHFIRIDNGVARAVSE